jgi:hypothetical protein
MHAAGAAAITSRELTHGAPLDREVAAVPSGSTNVGWQLLVFNNY